MGARYGRTEEPSGQAALFHVLLRASRPGALVRDEQDLRKLGGIVADMLFWCRGRVLACRCEEDTMQFALETAAVPVGSMCRYLTLPYALYFNQRRNRAGRVFLPFRAYLVQSAFRLDLVLWLHRRAEARGWSADGGYVRPGSLPWLDTSTILDDLGRGLGARRQYRRQRTAGVEPALAAAFASPGGRTPYTVRASARRAHTARQRRRQGELLRRVMSLIAERESVSVNEMRGRSHARVVSRARGLVALMAVRLGISLAEVSRALDRDPTTLRETVETLRVREPQQIVEVQELLARKLLETGPEES